MLCTLCGWHKNGKGVYSSVPRAQERVYLFISISVLCLCRRGGDGRRVVRGIGLTHVTADTHTPIAHVSLPTPQIHYPSRTNTLPKLVLNIPYTEAEFLDVIGKKVLGVFLFAIHSHLY